MINYESDFGIFFLIYIPYVFSVVFIFGYFGWNSSNINESALAKKYYPFQNKILDSKNWRLLKSFAILMGVLGLIGAVASIDKIYDEMSKPQAQKLVNFFIDDINFKISKLKDRSCKDLSLNISLCKFPEHAHILIRNGLIEGRISKIYIMALMQSAQPAEIAKFLLEEVDWVNQELERLNNRPAVDSELRLLMAIISTLALALSLAISFGEAVFQYRSELDKVDNKNINLSSENTESSAETFPFHDKNF